MSTSPPSQDPSSSSNPATKTWRMEAKPTPFWKFLLGSNLLKRNQLRAVSWNGTDLIVEVQSGRAHRFVPGSFTAKFIKTSTGLRDFTLKSTTKPVEKVVFRETLLQMPEEWWDQLAARLGAAESGLSKLLHGAKSFGEDWAESGSAVDAALNQLPSNDDKPTNTTTNNMSANNQTGQQGQPKRSGCMTLLMIIGGLVVLLVGGCVLFSGLLAVGVNEAVEESAAKEKKQLKSLETAVASDLRPEGELERIFGLLSEHTDIQRENKEKEITGKVVEWSLSVYEVSRSDDGYRIQTGDNDQVGTFINLHPRSDEERQKIEALKEGDPITVKGYISGITFRSVEIDPAILVR